MENNNTILKKQTTFHHICIQTENYNTSLDFYVKIFGFSIVKESKGFHTRSFNTWLKCGNMMIELQTAKAGQKLIPWSSTNAGPVHLCLLVDDVRLVHKILKEKGYAFKEKNGESLYFIENSPLCKVISPEGAQVEIRDKDI